MAERPLDQPLDETVKALVSACADIWVALKAAGQALEAFNAQAASGTISISGQSSSQGASPMSVDTGTATPIPAEDCPATVDWRDRLDTSIPHDKTQTNWSAEDEDGDLSQAVGVNPNLDQDSDDETATVVFRQSQGRFRVIAETQGASDVIRAESVLYDIQPGAPAVGTITLQPAS